MSSKCLNKITVLSIQCSDVERRCGNRSICSEKSVIMRKRVVKTDRSVHSETATNKRQYAFGG